MCDMNCEELKTAFIPFSKTMKAIENLQEMLKCQICKKPPMAPQSMGRCDHFFCESCISNSLNSCCPVCKIPSLPCERNPDSIVDCLVSSCTDLITLFNGGKLKINSQGLEAPESSYPFSTSKSTSCLKENAATKENISTKITEMPKTPSLRTSSRKGDASALTSKSFTSLASGSVVRSRGNLSHNIRSRKTASTSNVQQKTEAVTVKKKEILDIPLFNGNLEVPTTPKFIKNNIRSIELKTPTTPAVNKRNTKGETLLHSACIKGDLKKVQDLLSDGANPNTKDNAGWTPLHEACSHGFMDIAILLLEHGALVDVPGNDNGTPLHDAVTSGHVELICLLRKWGANDKIRDLSGRTPRLIADLCKSPSTLHKALNTEKDESLHALTMKPIQSKMVLTESDLILEYKKKLETVTKLLRVKLVNDISCSDVTYVIVQCIEGTKSCLMSIKYLIGVVSGSWILSHTWLDECLATGGPASPEKHEVSGSVSNPGSEAAYKGRNNASKMNPGLFKGCHMYLVGHFNDCSFSKKELEALIKTGGGIMLQREPNPESIDVSEQTVPFHADPSGPLAICSHYCIYQEGSNEPQLKYDMAHIKSLPLSWLLNCADNWSLVPPSKDC